MVYIGVSEERVTAKSMAMGSERTKPLHNFNLPWDLKWGSQKYLRCMKVDSETGGGVGDASAVDRRSSAPKLASSVRRRESEFAGRRLLRAPRPPRIENDDDGEEGIEAVREKLMFDLKTAANKMKDAILREEGVAVAVVAGATDVAADEEDAEVAEVAEEERELSPAAAAQEVRPWNLRTRRAACKAPIGGGGGGAKGLLRIEEKKANYSPLRSEGGNNNGVNSPWLVRGASGSGPEKERPKFSVSLTKKEIEEDFMAMLGHRPPRRPKKRPRAVQKQLDALFPGMWLTEVSAETYKVPEFPENAKR